MIREFLRRIIRWFDIGLPAYRRQPLAPIPRAANREDRHYARVQWWMNRYYKQRIGPPMLTGARLARVTAQCDPHNLITQPLYRRTHGNNYQ